VRDVVDNSEAVRNHIVYDSFGNITSQTDASVVFRYGYTGREFDKESGQYYYRSRYYDPTVGKFISEDLIGFGGGDSNLNRYVRNRPTGLRDSRGFVGEDIGDLFGVIDYSGIGSITGDAFYDYGTGSSVGDAFGFYDYGTGSSLGNALYDYGTGSSVGDAFGFYDDGIGSLLGQNCGSSIFGGFGSDYIVGGNFDDNIYNTLNGLDQFFGGFGNRVSFGGTNFIRNALYGKSASLNQNGFFYDSGEFLGTLTSFATSLLALAALGGTYAQTFAQGYTAAGAGKAAYDSTTRIGNGTATLWDALSFTPVAVVGFNKLGGISNAASGGGRIPISVEDALGKADKFMQQGTPIRTLNTKSGVQFIQNFTDKLGRDITRRAGFDLNPNSPHVNQFGPHLNLQTQINGVIQKKGAFADPHIPINPKTIRPGDY
jgi:RHS repeat-associated protein